MASTLRRGSILIIDDEELVRSAVARVLKRSYVVDGVPSIADALVRLEQGPAVTLVLCDESVGPERGSDLYERLTRDGDPVSERMLFMTGDRHAEHLRALGGGHVLFKPFAARDLLQVVSARIEQLAQAQLRKC